MWTPEPGGSLHFHREELMTPHKRICTSYIVAPSAHGNTGRPASAAFPNIESTMILVLHLNHSFLGI
jgi:hypothetical protein